MANQKPSSLRKLYSGSISENDLLIAVDVDELSSPTGETKTIDFSNLASAVSSRFSDATLIPYVSASLSGSIYDVVEQKLNISEGDLINDRITALDTDNITNASNIPETTLSDALDFLYVQSRSIAIGISSTQCFTANQGDTDFNLSPNVVPQNVLVYKDGLLESNTSYVLATDVLTLNNSASVGEEICVIDFGMTSSAGTTFLGLNDTPGQYPASVNSLIGVNQHGTALEYKPIRDKFSSLDDTPDDYFTSSNKLIRINPSGDGLDFISGETIVSASLLNEPDMSSSSDVKGVTQQSVISYVSSSIAERIINDSTFSNPSTINSPSQESVVNYIDVSFGNRIIDQDNMISNSPNHVPTQQSVKSYVDNLYSSNNGSSIAIIQETQPHGRYVTNTTTNISSTSFWNTYTGFTGTPFYNDTILSISLRFFKRNLNTLKLNRNFIIEDFNTSYSKFTLIPGYYKISGWVYGYDTRHNCIRLKRHTTNENLGTAYLASPPNQYSDNERSPPLPFSFYVEVDGSKNNRTFSIEHGIYEYNLSSDLGQPYQPTGQDEIYSQLEIHKL